MPSTNYNGDSETTGRMIITSNVLSNSFYHANCKKKNQNPFLAIIAAANNYLLR